MPLAAGGDGVDRSADRVDVDTALRQLPVEFRAPVVLRDLCGLDYAEIASVLDIPIGTVRSRIARGRSALFPLLAGNPEATPERPTAQP
jgi:RNA polymerase sigma-70 factor (ECF subfamily)